MTTDSILDRVANLTARAERLKGGAAYFQSFGFAPATVIDVGVFKGTPWLYRAFPDAKFHLIDPLPEVPALIAPWRREIDFDLHPVALGADDGEVTLNIPLRGARRLPNMTSAAERSAANIARQRVTGMEQVTAKVRRLDDLSNTWRGPLGLKIDTEGHEVEVLKGATETVKRCAFVVLEVSMQDRFNKGYRFSDAISQMAALGFEPLDFLSGLGQSPLFADILFTPFEDRLS